MFRLGSGPLFIALGLSCLAPQTGYSKASRPPKDEPAAAPAQAPINPAFTRLTEAHQYYAAIVEKGGWQKVPAAHKYIEKNNGEWLTSLARRLVISGDVDPKVLDIARAEALPLLKDAVKKFQTRHGLETDGVVGKGTLAELNVSAADRARQLETNLAAWKTISDQHLSGDRYIIVNIPEFILRAYQKNDEVLKMKVVVGREYTDNATPLFNDTLTQVVFRPYWNVPKSIATEEVVPETQADPTSFEKKNFELVDYYDERATIYPLNPENLQKLAEGKLLVRQKPGPTNALGRVKFLFPNKYNIYLHDTPEKHLFKEERRDFSHGCIRVEQPAELAGYVLSSEAGGWTAESIQRAMSEGVQKTVDLTQKIPVYIRYWTTYVDDDGTVQFRKDIYDQMLKVSGL